MEFVIENVLSELYEETDIAVDTVFYQEPGIYWIVTQSKEKAFPQDGGRDCEILASPSKAKPAIRPCSTTYF